MGQLEGIVRQTAAWAGGQGPEINRRLVLLERMELARPELFGAGKPPISVDEAMLAPGAPLPTAGTVWDRIGQQLQDIFDPNLVSSNPMAERAKGAVESPDRAFGRLIPDILAGHFLGRNTFTPAPGDRRVRLAGARFTWSIGSHRFKAAGSV
ncbi:hypothetical protein AB0K16_25600 [Nonomuraea jabiensis]|uniref:hypothetical protein n=1 Tax=Nonomuraea jabiensis TaxID=882448 RepID=UPI0034313621